MPTASTEDTMIEVRPLRSATLFSPADADAAGPQPRNPVERCRALFRQIGERMSSFDLSRQIYG